MMRPEQAKVPGTSTDSDYRARLYASYVCACHEVLAPNTPEGLAPRAPYLRKLIRQHFPPQRDIAVLDLGCGHGALTYFAQEAGYRNVLAVDRSPEQVAAARRLGISAVREGDLMAVLASERDESRDLIVTFDVLEHFRKDEILLFVDEVRRVLKTGGKWIIHAPNGEAPFGSRILFSDFTHEAAFTRISIAQILLASRFRSVECFEDTPVPHGVKSLVRYLLWKVIRGGLRLYMAVETGEGRNHIFSQNFLTVAVK